MPVLNDDLKEHFAVYRQIKISVIGRKSGKTISIPVWFVVREDQLFLLPVHGSDTQWYKNMLRKPSIAIEARESGAEFRAISVTGGTRLIF
jgi:hypothetical protein